MAAVGLPARLPVLPGLAMQIYGNIAMMNSRDSCVSGGDIILYLRVCVCMFVCVSNRIFRNERLLLIFAVALGYSFATALWATTYNRIFVFVMVSAVCYSANEGANERLAD